MKILLVVVTLVLEGCCFAGGRLLTAPEATAAKSYRDDVKCVGWSLPYLWQERSCRRHHRHNSRYYGRYYHRGRHKHR